MIFSDDDLKRLKDKLNRNDPKDNYSSINIMKALLARLEAAEDFIDAVNYDFVAADDELLGCWKAWRKACGK